jgi:uncharacterized protein with PIN domain
MRVIHLRFYEELNDHLPREQRRRTFAWECAAGTTVRGVVEALGVPPAEVDLILANGESAAFDREVHDGDRVSVYPKFESFDIAAVQRLRGAPLRDIRFLADGHLARLARYLRLLGFDTLCPMTADATRKIRAARDEKRIVLTRSRRLAADPRLTHALLVLAEDPGEQLAEIVDRLHLHEAVRPFTRCLLCNEPVVEVEKSAVAERLEAETRAHFDAFRRCPRCDRVYWEGSHHRRLSRLIERVLQRRAP